MKKVIYITVGTVISVVLAFSIYNLINPKYVLVIEEVKAGEILWQQPVEEGDWFRHEYIHSVEKSKVIEKFKLAEDGQMLAMESWTRSFGAGLPYEQKGNVAFIDGYYVLSELYDPLEQLNMIPSHLYLHTFHFKGEEIILSEPPFRRTHIKFETRQQSFFEKIHYFFDTKQ